MSLFWPLRFLNPRTCLNCGSLCAFEGLLCGLCRNVIEERWQDGLTWGDQEFGTVKTLCEWNPGESDILSTLIHGLKGSRQKAAWKFYAQKFLHQQLQECDFEGEIIFVTPPYSTSDRLHAEFWGEGLASLLSAPKISPFGLSSEKQQKHARLEERAERRFVLREQFTNYVRENRSALWVFADDVVTTGSTAKAAFLALESPPHFEVWALAQRGALLRSVLGSVINAE